MQHTEAEAAVTPVLRVGRLPDFPPFWFKNPEPGHIGFDHDIVEAAVARVRLPRPTYITMADFDLLDNALTRGEIDVIANNVWKVPDRIHRVLYSTPYY